MSQSPISDRRDFLGQTLAVGLTTLSGSLLSPALAKTLSGRGAGAVLGASRDPGSLKKLGGFGDGYKMTIGADGRQIVVVNDGPGWAPPPAPFYVTRLWTIEGGPEAPRFEPLAGYPKYNRADLSESSPSYFGNGVIAIGDHLYQFLATLDNAEDRPRHWRGSKLIYSTDGGASWRNSDGSSPVKWESWDEQASAGFPFFNETDGCFSVLTILQQGRAYGANRDGYVYVYGLNGSVDGLINQVVMFRVPKDKLLDRASYRFFAGVGKDGKARWSADIAHRQPVHTFPRGWVNNANLFPGDLVLESWKPSIVYNEPLGLYMMAAAGIGCAPDGTAFGKPSYLQLLVSEHPWGPWRKIHDDTAWMPAGDPAARAYAPQIAPGWIAADGKSFWLAWADCAGLREYSRDKEKIDAELAKIADPGERTIKDVEVLRRYIPDFSMQAQRIELKLA